MVSSYFCLDFMFHQHCNGHMATFLASTALERPQVCLCGLFQAQAGTLVEPPAFRKLAA